jgi:hypothetical protein
LGDPIRARIRAVDQKKRLIGLSSWMAPVWRDI